MNFAASLYKLFFALAHLSAVKTAVIPKEVENSKNDVVPFMDVYNKSLCRPRELLVDIYQEYPEEIEHTYIPSCVVLMRCGGCCNDEALECVPVATRNVTLEVKRVKLRVTQHNFLLSFTEHTSCECRPKKEVKEKKAKKPGRGEGQKRKRRKERGKRRHFHCEPCSERRRRIYVQDPFTCKCSCKYSQLYCKSRQLELNQRTCRCDKPRR
ncbi:vascular endothelial growth factor A-A isoform X1 [Anguilla rostrata]|uniref:vascular endothelial growth factor A-A isoform X1 n=1 Tax=Anguilla anguilla TaxID=7936 RepID=UPI0015AF2135|nr:vascular endothelial growth factor A-A isoform X1 [Anguilla anguilla]